MSSSSGNVYCAALVKVSKESESEEKKNTVIWELIDVFKPYTALFLLCLFRRCRGIVVDEISE